MIRDHHGISLVEVLVSLLVLSIGLLGLAGLQGVALKTADSANLRATAAALSHEILEHMRANRSAALSGDYDLDLNAANPTTPSKNCDTASCTAAEIAEYDVYQWWYKITDGNSSGNKFPSGDASLAVDQTTGIASVSIQWNDARADIDKSSSSRTVTFTLSTKL